MTINPLGVVLFVVFCALLTAALSDPTWMKIAEVFATVLIALSLAGGFFPSLVRVRGL